MDEQHFEAIPPSAISQYARTHVFPGRRNSRTHVCSFLQVSKRFMPCGRQGCSVGRTWLHSKHITTSPISAQQGRIRVLRLCIASAKCER